VSDTATVGAGTASPPKKNPLVVLRDYLFERADSLRNALPPHIKPERFISAVLTAVQINPDLLACDRRSLFIACMRCAQDGLLPDGNEAAIVPYKAKAQYLCMYQGLLKKFRNSGQFKWVTAGIAYEGDVYEHWIDETGEHFKHIPSDDHTGKKIRRVYALATTKDGGSFITELSIADVDKRRSMSRASREDAPWKQWPDEMMKKTALRVLSKLLPKSSDLDAFLQADEKESLGVETADAVADQRGAAFGSVLDHFAETGKADNEPADNNQTSSTATASATDDRGDAADGGGPQGAMGASTPSGGSAAAADNALEIAFRRGQQARIAGHARKAIPGEYREASKTREALCWQSGFDGNPMPTFPSEEPMRSPVSGKSSPKATVDR
jgi:recombination protein RecT